MKKYSIIYADPPWRYTDKATSGAAENHYSTMHIDDICKLPIKELAAEDCVLFLWATYPLLPEALRLIKEWGFKYKTLAFQWVKLNPKCENQLFITKKNICLGLGNWTRGNTEPCLLATKGKPKKIRCSISQVILEPRQRHSKKPDIVRDKIIELLGDLPRVELFARNKTDGWDVWGNEVEKDIELCG